MRLDNSAGQGTLCHTPPQGTDNVAAVPSRISSALFSNQAAVWVYSAGKESHIPEEGREPGREEERERGREGEEVAGACEVSSWPSPTPQGTLLAGTQGRLLSSYYTSRVSHAIALKFQSQQAMDIHIQRIECKCFFLKKMHIKQGSLRIHFQPECFEGHD